MEKQLPLADLDKLLLRLRERGVVYAPKKDETGEVVLAELAADESVVLDYRNFRLSPKSFFLPQNQTMIRFKDGEAAEPQPPKHETFLFGVRPCDARALLALDQVFLRGDEPDPYYARLRAGTTVIALACTRPLATCFCTSVGGGPDDASGADVLAVALDDELLLKGQTPKGDALMLSLSEVLAEVSPAAVAEAKERLAAVTDPLALVNVEDSVRRLRDAYGSPLWETVGRKCLGCGTCSFLCPTCHCFDITDEVRNGTGRRLRTWDCCAYGKFTLHASGHNPRPGPKERWRQRIMHKFRYAVEHFDRLFCVGCGRCIRNCPVGLDLRAVLKEVGA